jgi:WhiB family redox-sensing transcriptional regulator
LEGAISRAEPCGVWGGELFDEGKIITAKRKAGRPRLTPSLQDGSMSEMELAS